MASRTRTAITGFAAAAMLAVGTLAATAPAAEAKQYNWQQNQNDWQWRHKHRHYYNGYDNGGGAVAAGIIGLIAGTFLGSALSQSNHSVGYCIQHFKSYDIGSRSYLGFDGFRHPCG